MINRFEIARFIEHESTKVIVGLGILIVFLAGLIFYLYGLGAINDFQGAVNSEALDQAKVAEALKDIDARSAEWEHLKKTARPAIDIFK